MMKFQIFKELNDLLGMFGAHKLCAYLIQRKQDGIWSIFLKSANNMFA